jgi:flagellar biosynthesis anti-sigma factor FlgM
MLEKNIRIAGVGPIATAGRTATIRTGAAHSAAPVSSPASAAAAPAQSDVLAMATAIANQSPPVDTARVSALRDMIASGDYSINIAATALAIANALGDLPQR